jgi:uncharacterized membrane protein YphA (DoxX/SURF4 family)
VTDLAAAAFLAGRLVYAGALLALVAGNVLDYSASVAYADSKGVPLPAVAVPAGSLLVVAGAASFALGAYPVLGAAAVVAFLLPVTVLMHDFWTMEGQQRGAEYAQFVKNAALAGSALVLAGVAGGWPYALGGTLA